MKKMLFITTALLLALSFAAPVMSAEPKSKFYDFSDQMIDGAIKKPTTLFTDSRTQVKFDRLLKLKKSFIKDLLLTAKERTFK